MERLFVAVSKLTAKQPYRKLHYKFTEKLVFPSSQEITREKHSKK